MKKVRNGVFETNSSSSHSITLNGILLSEDALKTKNVFPVDEIDGKIHIKLEDCQYGWGFDLITNPWGKLQYAIMMVIETEAGKCEQIKDVYELDGFKLIQSVVETPIVIEDVTFCREEYTLYNNEKHYYLKHAGYIDHQSYEDYVDLNHFLNSNGIDIINFIYNTYLELEISNDNM